MGKQTNRVEIVLWEDADEGTMAIDCPYHEEWLKEFKAVVPYEDRNPRDDMGWDKNDKVWRVPVEYAEQVEATLKKHFPEIPMRWDYI